MRIALWNTAFLGDAILTLPLLQSLRVAYPDAQIDFYVRAGLKELFIAHPAISTVYEVQKNNHSLSPMKELLATIKKQKYYIWISAHLSVRSSLFAYLSGAKKRIGYSEAFGASFWFTEHVSRNFAIYPEIERLLGLLQPLAIDSVQSWPEVYLPSSALQTAEDVFSSFSAKPCLGVHPGSVWATKRWPVKSFATIALQAMERGAEIVLFAGKGEEGIAHEMQTYLREKNPERAAVAVHNLSGTLSLPELAACLRKVSCYITNDSGPMHLAWVQKTPVVALFGPTVEKLGFYPRGATSHVFETSLECRPCGLHGHKSCPLKHHNCMNTLSPVQVWPQVELYLFGNTSNNKQKNITDDL